MDKLARGAALLWPFVFLVLGCSGSDTAPPVTPTQSSSPPSDPAPPPTPPPSIPPPPPAANPAGPWPVADLTRYDSVQGLNGIIIDAGADDGQAIWAAAPDALYVLRPGQSQFQRFTAGDGLHIQPFLDPTGQPAVTHITAIAGGRANEVFVGYKGYEGVIPPPAPPPCCMPNADFSDPRWSLGQGDKVTFNPDGTIQVHRYLFRCDNNANCWEERSVRRMVFAHQGVAAGHLFIGFDHGVTHVYADAFGDHTHVQTYWHYDDGRNVQRMGEQYGLAVFPNGDLLTAGAYGVGVQPFNPDPQAWVVGRFVWAFTTHGPATPYNGGAHDLLVPAGYREDNRGAAVTPDGTAWWISLHTGLSSYNHGTARGNYSLIRTWDNVPGLPTSGLLDLAADPDGSLWIVDNQGRLLRFDPSALSVRVWPGVSNVRRIVVDATVVPRALYVSMGPNGVAVIRAP